MRIADEDEVRRIEEKLNPPTRESFHLEMAKRCYVEDMLTVDELERSVAHVLSGGHLTRDGRPA